ncbi:acyl-CoA Delta-9 desaturase-like isoform X1 [Musca autumnalis]|uniref:acyl-CoA Delta-9 desaturase-like isoform X1 n=2 Tax=Musca autumnalis TaxID=221902 RepID=UPI003CF16D67
MGRENNMPPNATTTVTKNEPMSKVFENTATGVLSEQEAETIDGGLAKNIEKYKKAEERKLEIVWINVIGFVYVYAASFYGIYLMCTSAKWQTNILGTLLTYITGFGITAAAHRLWAHRAYKANLPMRIMLIIFNTIAFQNSVYVWARDHRVHHKFSETDADPHNATRGMFFSHIGWLMCKKHPEVKAKGKTIDMSDLEADPIVMFQHKYYYFLMPIACFILPAIAPMFLFNETFSNSWHICVMLRWCFLLNSAWLINSAGHKYGSRPYDKSYNPAENSFIAFLTLGEGWHNYHHVFPWDYKTSELGDYMFNYTTAFLDFFAKLGWAYDLKTVSDEIIRKRVQRTGDGSHPIWGWGDKDQSKDEIDAAIIVNKKDQ